MLELVNDINQKEDNEKKFYDYPTLFDAVGFMFEIYIAFSPSKHNNNYIYMFLGVKISDLANKLYSLYCHALE